MSVLVLLFLVSEILHMKYSRNWTKLMPTVLYFTEASREPERDQRGALGAPPHMAARPRRGGAPAYGGPPPGSSEAALPPIYSLRLENPKKISHGTRKVTQPPPSRSQVRGTEVSVLARHRDGEVPPEGISIDTTAIFIVAAVSHDEEGVVLPRG